MPKQEKAAADLPSNHPLKIRETALVEKLESLNGQNGSAGHDIYAARQRTESQLDQVRAAIKQEAAQ